MSAASAHRDSDKKQFFDFRHMNLFFGTLREESNQRTTIQIEFS